MATRTALLNGNVINRDADFSKHIEAVSEPGVISGFAVSSSSVSVGQALVKCERTNGDTIYAVVYNNSGQEISGNGDVFIEIAQELIDNGELMNEDGSEIAEIKVGTMPSKNALKLAVKSGSTITDARNMIKKSGELLALINQNIEDISDLDDRVEALEEAGAIDHLEESALVGEVFTLSNSLFKQYTPTLENAEIDCLVSNTSDNAQIHIQRIGSGVESNQLKLKVRMVGESTQNLKVEVRRGAQVVITEGVESYWYGNQAIASGSIPYSEISSTYAEKTVTLNANFGGTKGELLDIVVYMDTVNASNYYCIACDKTQYSEGFSYVSVNGNTRTRSKLMPYGVSNGFIQSILAKVGEPDRFDVNGSESIVKEQSDFWTPGTYMDYLVYKNDSLYDETVNGEALYTGTDYKAATLRRCVDSGAETQINAFNQSAPVAFGPITVPAGSTLYIRFRSWGNNESRKVNTAYVKIIINRSHYYLSKNSDTVGLPIEQKGLGEFGKITIWGMHNGKFYTQATTTSVTTGQITLGNAVGYLNIGGYKIPYYL